MPVMPADATCDLRGVGSSPGRARRARRLAEEASFIQQSNDPSGFNVVDLLAYGSLGHALGFLLLACNSLGTKPIPF